MRALRLHYSHRRVVRNVEDRYRRDDMIMIDVSLAKKIKNVYFMLQQLLLIERLQLCRAVFMRMRQGIGKGYTRIG